MVTARGLITEELLGLLGQAPAAARGSVGSITSGQADGVDALSDEDLQLALYLCYELHYQGLPGVSDDWEWAPELVRIRRELERRFEAALLENWPRPEAGVDVRSALMEMAHGGTSTPSLSAHMAAEGTLDQMRELCIHRSAYQLKEADPHTWGIPRLTGQAKAAMVEIQMDEYGSGRRGGMHSVLFGETMDALGLDASYGFYLDRIPGSTLATVNLVSMLGLHRKRRAALVGHLALFEMSSVGPMSRYSECLKRLGVEPRARRFYDVHVEADARHEKVALDRMVNGLLDEEPECGPDIVLGARWLTGLEARFSRRVMACWSEGICSLYQ